MRKKALLLTAMSAVIGANAVAQSSTTISDDYNPIPTSVQMVNIAPEARSTGMGDCGVATTPDVNSQHWNPAKYIRMESKSGVGISVTPWLRNIISDINLFNMAGYYKVNDRNVVSASINYFSLGDLVFYNDQGDEQGSYKPNEFSIDAAYTLGLSEVWSGAVALRYIHSDLGFQQDDEGYSKGNAFAADIAFYFHKPIKLGRNLPTLLMAGVDLSNIGTKISYDSGTTNEYLPANFRIGAGLWVELDRYNTIGATVDFNKLMVPTPEYGSDSDSGEEDAYSRRQKYYDQSVIASIFKSFGDAPGGFKEEIREFDFSVGMEYTYNNMFSARLGYHHNPENKGNLKYGSAGAGVRYQMIDVNASYIFAVGNANHNSALANTIRISLGFDIGYLMNGGSSSSNRSGSSRRKI